MVAEVALKAETRANEKRIAALTDMVIDSIKMIQERTGVDSIVMVANSSSSSSSWSGGEYAITGSPQAVEEAKVAIREIIQE
eukprot:3263181-Heterocapsa_arctica.AAC.1